MNDANRAPLAAAMKAYAASGALAFHTPGHKNAVFFYFCGGKWWKVVEIV